MTKGVGFLFPVTPAKAGVQMRALARPRGFLDPSLRWDDEFRGDSVAPLNPAQQQLRVPHMRSKHDAPAGLLDPADP